MFAELGIAKLRRPHHVISNPIDTSLFRPAREATRGAARARFGLVVPTITYAGRLGRELRGIQTGLVRAYAFVVVGGAVVFIAYFALLRLPR